MTRSALQTPTTDPVPIFELFRSNFATELLTAAVTPFRLFEHLANQPLSFDELRNRLGLAERAAVVLFTALRAMNLIQQNAENKLDLVPIAREHLLPDGAFYVGDYVGLLADSPGVKTMVERLKTNRPAGVKPEESSAYIFREGNETSMEEEDSARHLTLALAGRAKNVAPFLAQKVPMNSIRTLLDIGGGTGIYSIALLQKNPTLQAIVWDRPEVLKVAHEFAQEYGVADRLQLIPGDMFRDPFPGKADAMLLSNILHDWDIPECQQLVNRCAEALPKGGQLLIHDVFLNDAHDGPLPIAMYSTALFTLTEGRAYSAAEYRSWLQAAGLQVQPILPTYLHCGVIAGVKG